MPNIELVATAEAAHPKPLTKVQRILDSLASDLPPQTAFEVELFGELQLIGNGPVKFRLCVNTSRGMSALVSLDEKQIGEAYLDGDIDVQGDLVAALELRTRLTDCHPLAYLWSTYGQRLLFGQVSQDKRWIHEHYDIESDFYLTFLDSQHRCYSHGYFEDEAEPLERGIRRKLDTAIEACGIRPGWRVLDIGAGWGAFTEHAGRRGVSVTSLTISAESESYVKPVDRSRAPALPGGARTLPRVLVQ